MAVDHEFDKIEYYIVKGLLTYDLYCRSYVSKLSNDLFSIKSQDLVKGIRSFFNKYKKLPSPKILEDKVIPVICKNDKMRINQAMDCLSDIMAIDVNIADSYEWLCDETKKFIKTKRIINAFVECSDLLEEHKHEEIYKIMKSAFEISFDETMGIEYFSGMEDRLSRSGLTQEIIPTGYKSLDSRIGGGYRRKSMFVFAGSSNVGKTLVLNDAASTLAYIGYNVLYLSLELSEDYIQQRTDAKFANVPIEDINIDPAEAIRKAIARREQLKKEGKKLGKLIYKEYSPNTISSNDISALIRNLEIHQNFKPDFIIIDYLKLVKPNGKAFSDNTYGKIVTVCEELRGLAFEHNACVLSAAQTGRQSYNQSSVGMEDIADSIGIAQTVDVLVTLARTSELDEDNSIIISIAKSRFSRNGGSFLAKVNYTYMKIIDEVSDSIRNESYRTSAKVEDIEENEDNTDSTTDVVQRRRIVADF
jgi:replicative DNA helicase